MSASAEKILVVAPRYPETAYGDTVRVTGILKRPENFSGFDYAGYLAKDDIYFTMNYADVALVREERYTAKPVCI